MIENDYYFLSFIIDIPKKCVGLNGEQYNTGDSWQLNDDCHRCNCIDGVQKCESIENCPYKCLPANHTEKLDSNQCCPRCKGWIIRNSLQDFSLKSFFGEFIFSLYRCGWTKTYWFIDMDW